MKSKLIFYLLMGIATSVIFPVAMWAGRYELKGSSVEGMSTKINIPLSKRVGGKTRGINMAPCTVMYSDDELIFIFDTLSHDAEIILYNETKEILRISISQHQQDSEIIVPIDYLESGSYTLEVVTASSESWYGYFEYVSSNTFSL